MIAALADAGAVLGRDDYIEAARRCAEFVLKRMRDADGRLLRTYKDGRASLNAYLEDHAFLCEALLVLYEATLETRWFVEARAARRRHRLAVPRRSRRRLLRHRLAITRRWSCGPAASRTIRSRPATPQPPTRCCASKRSRAIAPTSSPRSEVFRIVHQAAARHPQAFGHLLQAMHFHFSPPREVALVGDVAGRARGAGAAALPADGRAGRDGGPATRRHWTRSRCCAAASRWTAAPPHTCARTSPAGCRSRSRRSSSASSPAPSYTAPLRRSTSTTSRHGPPSCPAARARRPPGAPSARTAPG